jgi:hypothetical protein
MSSRESGLALPRVEDRPAGRSDRFGNALGVGSRANAARSGLEHRREAVAAGSEPLTLTSTSTGNVDLNGDVRR